MDGGSYRQAEASPRRIEDAKRPLQSKTCRKVNSCSSATTAIEHSRLERQLPSHCRRLSWRAEKTGPRNPGDRLPKTATHTIDPQETITVLVSPRQVSERSGRTVRTMTESSSAIVDLVVWVRLGQQNAGLLPFTCLRRPMNAYQRK